MSLILSDKLRGVPMDVRKAYKNDKFLCDCGGSVLPFTMKMGVCIHCGEESNLADLDYEFKEGEED